MLGLRSQGMGNSEELHPTSTNGYNGCLKTVKTFKFYSFSFDLLLCKGHIDCFSQSFLNSLLQGGGKVIKNCDIFFYKEREMSFKLPRREIL